MSEDGVWRESSSAAERKRRAPRPLDPRRLDELAVRYVGRYATTQHRLTKYLERKLSERGWSGDCPPTVEQVVERCVAAGYVDDTAFAAARAGALERRGYGNRRIGGALREAGIDKEVAEQLRLDGEQSLVAALRFAQRRRFARFSSVPRDAQSDRRQMAAMARAGHGFDAIKQVFGAVDDGSQ